MKKDSRYYKAEALAFIEAHPDYVVSEENFDHLIEWLKKNNVDLNRDTLAAAWKALKEAPDANEG